MTLINNANQKTRIMMKKLFVSLLVLLTVSFKNNKIFFLTTMDWVSR